jgi:hypothetical protein
MWRLEKEVCALILNTIKERKEVASEHDLLNKILEAAVKGYQASMRSSAIQRRSIAKSSEGSIAPSVAPSVCLEERRRDVRSIAGSVASSVANEGRRRDVRSIAYHK